MFYVMVSVILQFAVLMPHVVRSSSCNTGHTTVRLSWISIIMQQGQA